MDKSNKFNPFDQVTNDNSSDNSNKYNPFDRVTNESISEDKKLDYSNLKNDESAEDIEVLSLDDSDKIDDILSAEERKIKKTGITKKMVVLIVLVGFLLATGYTTFALGLAFDGRLASDSADGIWDIGFTDIHQKSKSGKAYETSKPTYTHHTATFNVGLVEPGDEITYSLTIKNSGNLDAKLSSIVITPENNENDVILYYISGIKAGDVLDAGRKTDMTVTAKYSTTHGSHLAFKSVNVILNYVQK